MVKFSIHSIRKRTREDLGKDREVAHTDVRRRERIMHGRIFVPWIEGWKKRRKIFVANDTYAEGRSFGAASWTLAMHTGEKTFLASHGRSVDGAMLKM